MMTRRQLLISIPSGILGFCLVLSGCGGGANSETTVTLKPATRDQDVSDPGTVTGEGGEDTVAAGGSGPGNIVGQILFEGSAPSLSPLVAKGANVRDKEYCSVNAVPNEGIVVGENGGLANVFVYLEKAPSGVKPDEDLEPIVLDQKGCKFIPHTLLAQTGQPIQFINSDGCAHNTNASFVRNAKFNSTINANDSVGVTIELDRSENQPVKTVCDFHTWMVCYLFVVDHPFAAVTDENGNFEIKGLPPGKHRFRVWHESGDFLERSLTVDVKPGEDTKVDLKYNISKFPKL
jgi:plastocyanin